MFRPPPEPGRQAEPVRPEVGAESAGPIEDLRPSPEPAPIDALEQPIAEAELIPDEPEGQPSEPEPVRDELDAPHAPERPPVASRPARVIAIANQKGGVGKSTTAVNLGASLADAGERVLVIDLDPQGNASTGLGIDHSIRERTTYDVLTAGVHPWEAIVETPVAGLWALPSTIDLAGAEIELVSQFAREARLSKALDDIRFDFDFVLLDCPPSIGLLTVNAMTAADEVIVPIQCEYYALEGLGQLLKNVRLVQQNVNPRLRLTGILLTMFDARTKLSDQVVSEVRAYFGDRVYESIIPRSVRLSEAPGYGQPITQYDPASKGAQAYRHLAEEVRSKPAGAGVDLARLMGEESFGAGPAPTPTPEPPAAVEEANVEPTAPVEEEEPSLEPEQPWGTVPRWGTEDATPSTPDHERAEGGER